MDALGHTEKRRTFGIYLIIPFTADPIKALHFAILA